MKPGYRTSQASAAESGVRVSPLDSSVTLSRSRRVRPHASRRKRGPERRSADEPKPEPERNKEIVRVGKTATSSEVKRWWLFFKCSVYAFLV